MADESDGGGAGMLPQQALLAAIVDSSFDAIISKTLDGVITSWNGAAQRIFGYEASEAVGRSISILLPPERLEEEAFILQRLRRGERIANFETVRVRKDGRLIDVSVTSSPVRDRTATIVGASKVVRDISEANATRRALARSEARFRAIFDGAFEFFCLMSLDGRIVETNQAALRLGSDAIPDVLGRPLWEGSWFRDSAQTRHDLELAFGRVASGVPARLEVAVRAGDVQTTLDLSLRPIPDATGAIILVVAEGRDITERKRSELALLASESRLAGIVDSAMDAIITVDESGRILVFNDAAGLMFGHGADEIRGASLDRLIPARFLASHHDDMMQFGRSGTRQRAMGRPGEIVALKADGSEFPVEASISHVEVNGHRLFTVMMRDLSEVKQAQAERRALEAQLREAQKMEAVGTLAGGIAHDFNNIMGSIVGNVGLMKAELPPDHVSRPGLDQIDRAASRARSLVKQILAFSRRNPQQLKSQPLRPLIAEVLDLLRATVPSMVRLESKLSDVPMYAMIDATQIHQVLVNLCTNAWHALCGSTGRIEVGLELANLELHEALRLGDLVGGPHAHVWVADNGCGMDATTRERVFEPFFTTKAPGEGTGLGLSVVHGIVIAHRGAISVASMPGSGSTFHLYLPASLIDENEAPTASNELPPTAIGRGERVVYIDDDEVMGLMATRLLERSGFNVSCYQEPALALAAIRRDPQGCDVVVTDYNMPEHSGIDVAVAIRDIRPELPIILSSGYVADTLREAASAVGIKALLSKENTFEELAGLISSVLHTR